MQWHNCVFYVVYIVSLQLYDVYWVCPINFLCYKYYIFCNILPMFTF